MTAQLSPTPIFKGFDNNGLPLAFGTLTTYQAGTTTLQATYVDSTQATTNTNPITLNFRGECALWLDPTKTYKYLLKDFFGNTVAGYPVDNIPGTPLTGGISFNLTPNPTNTYSLGSSTNSFANLYLGASAAPALDITTGNIGYYARTAAEISAGVTPTSFAYPDGHVLRYGADPLGVADSTYAFQQACFSTYAGWSGTARPRQIIVPSGRFKFSGVNTPYGTPTVFVRQGMSLIGSGMGTFYDCSAWGAVATNVFQGGWGFISGVATQDAGAQPWEIAEAFFLGGPSAGGACINGVFPGWYVHDCWFSGSGLGIYAGGGKVYDCTFDVGLVGMTIAAGNQEVINCDFFNQNFNITFNTTPGDLADVMITGCVFQYPTNQAISISAGTNIVQSLKIVACEFLANSQYSTFQAYIFFGNNSMSAQVSSCTFHNWGGTAGSSIYAILMSAAGGVIDFVGCLSDGNKSNSGYTQSTTAAAIFQLAGTVRLNGCVIRNLPTTYGFGVSLTGSAACVLQMSGCQYSNIGVNAGVSNTQLVNITNSNAGSIVYLEGIKGDAIAPMLNAQATVALQVKNCTDWFGPITTSGASHCVLGVPYQLGNAYQITLRANMNAGGNASYRKCIVTGAAKSNDFTGVTPTSYIDTAVLFQGAAHGNGTLTLVVEFGTVGGTTSIALSNSGNLAISWPNTYSLESVDVQMLI